MRRLPVLVLGLVLLLAPAAQARKSGGHCAPRSRSEKRVAASAVAVVLRDDAADTRLVGCSRRTGKRRLLADLSEGFSGGDALTSVRLVGSQVLYGVVTYEIRYENTRSWRLLLDDALRGGTLRRVPVDDVLGHGPFAHLTLNRSGDVAWLSGDRVLRWRRDDGLRVVDEGGVPGAPRWAGRDLGWTMDGTPRTLSGVTVPAGCGMASAPLRTDTLDIAYGLRDFEICHRPTGTRSALPRVGLHSLRDVDVEGGYVAAAEADWLWLVDAARGVVEAVRPGGSTSQARVDAHGSLAWLEPGAQPGGRALWVRDAGGERVVHEDASGPPLVRTGSVVRLGTFSYTLQPAG